MRTIIESTYKGRWIELIEVEDEGLFLAGIRITTDAPGAPSRKWENLDTEIAVYFDFESASEDALIQAKAHIDKKH
ncbi:hypothetical protein CSC67_17925 [Pusillimonas caeni]|uniref:hypothetical protein n=1 Tax=Pusillimonas caeni TaxID=1348472 RepID=UPI000E5A06C0|nr:hypothetical protein [Pusillimonas caeni]TFL10241.1 hypothetical protein CSC67_17925 [Pusillimonas caeni]